MARAEGGPPDPAGIETTAGYLSALRQLRVWSGFTYRQLAEHARMNGDSLPASTMATVLQRTTLPRRDVVEAFVRACGLDDSAVAAWVATRDMLAVRVEAAVRETAGAPPAQPSPPRAADPTAPRTLPRDIADFTGRTEQVQALLEQMTGPSPTAVITGMGGAGKTSLAVHVAHRVADAFPDGQLYVNLLGAQASPLEPYEALSRFLRHLGVPSRAIPGDLDGAAEMFRARVAHRSMLFVLDDAAGEVQVRPLLPGVPTCGVLVTSRDRLPALDSPLRIDLDELPIGEALGMFARVAGEQRVLADPVPATRVVELCAGLPLAVRIAGGRLATRPAWRAADLARMLEDQRRRLDHLTAGDLGVRASLELSYQGLGEPARRLFRLLGLLNLPDFPAWVAAAVLDTSFDHGFDLLETLVDAHLVIPCGSDRVGQQRYRFHDLVRLYAAEQGGADRGEGGAALTRVFGAWLWITERMADAIPGPCFAAISGPAPRFPLAPIEERFTSVDPIGWFDAERACLMAVIRQACALGLDNMAFDLAQCMEKYFDVRGMYPDWVAINSEVMECCRRAGNKLGEAVMLRGLLDVTTWISEDRTEAAMARLYTEGLRLMRMFTEVDRQAGASDAAVMCSWALTAGGDHAGAVNVATTALELAERSNHPGGQVRAHLALAVAHYEQANYEVAAGHLPLALRQARILGNPRSEATVLQFAGIAHREMGMLDSSEQMLTESLRISRRYQDTYTEVLTMLALAQLQQRRGDPQARTTALTSLRLAREFSMAHHLAEALKILGEIEMADGDPGQAVAYLEESVSIWRTRGWRSFHAAALATLGRAYDQGSQQVRAREAYEEARRIYLELGNQERAGELMQLTGAAPA